MLIMCSCTRHSIKTPKMGEKTSFSCVKYAFFGFNVFMWVSDCYLVVQSVLVIVSLEDLSSCSTLLFNELLEAFIYFFILLVFFMEVS